ncbi:EthD family reductase [Klenkia terrae]|uniref:EthD family reductase n=1 Tax=Klenkia terrae TaxID=1052259 RepID=UPI00361126C8
MHILTVAYGQPIDPAAFDAHYESTHLPLAQQVPGVRNLRALQGASLDDSPAPYHLVVELTFDSLEDLNAGLSSPRAKPPPVTSPTSPTEAPPCSSSTTDLLFADVSRTRAIGSGIDHALSSHKRSASRTSR